VPFRKCSSISHRRDCKAAVNRSIIPTGSVGRSCPLRDRATAPPRSLPSTHTPRSRCAHLLAQPSSDPQWRARGADTLRPPGVGTVSSPGCGRSYRAAASRKARSAKRPATAIETNRIESAKVTFARRTRAEGSLKPARPCAACRGRDGCTRAFANRKSGTMSCLIANASPGASASVSTALASDRTADTMERAPCSMQQAQPSAP
jgi:hypothetical protein